MAITNFIPSVWSENLYRALNKQYIAVANCNREFEGDIKEQGSVVKICGVGNININNYSRNVDMQIPQTLSDTVCELPINMAKYFNFQIDDIDRAQCTPKLMDAAMSVAASALANEADRQVYQLYMDHPYVVYDNPDETTIFDKILEAREMLYSANVSDGTEVVLEVSPAVATLIYKAKLNLSTSNGETLENGCIGSIAGCKVFVSGNVMWESGEIGRVYKCFMRTKRAIAFAEQLSEIHAFRPEKRFADAVKGLHLYGIKVIYPKEFVVLEMEL